eukprot:XP_011662800.1 PREDICTED: CUB and zona pellucida-like domain-containing protein 1 [Strongylocentrotus purpuratus]
MFEISDTFREIGKVQCEPTNPCDNGGTCENNTCVCPEGFSGNFCHLDACDSICVDGTICEQGSCTCPAGYAGNMCQDKLTSVECGSTSMTVNIDKRLVPGDASGVHFRNHSCYGVNSSITEITLTTNYDQCGTTFEEDNTTITFTNVITYAKPGSEDGTVITREYHMQVRVECCLKKEEIVSGSFRPQLGEVSFSDKGSGDFSLKLERFQTYSFENKELDTTSFVLQQQNLFLAVGLNSVSNVGMFIESCWATTTQGSDTVPQYSLISSGCQDDGTVVINRLLGLNREGFSFKAFAFVGDYTEVYIHCLVNVCGAVEAQSIRDAGCPSETPPSDQPPNPDRKRRSSSFMSTQTISNGPIHIRRSTSDMATNDLSSYNPLAMLLLGMIAILVAMAILMGVVKLVRISSDNNYYQRVHIAESMEGI